MKTINTIGIIGDVHLKLTNPRCRKDNYLDSLLNKLEYIIQQNDMVICLGDLFDKASVEEQCKNRFLQLLMSYNKPFYTIFGNHDLFKYSIDSLDETSLGICFIKNAVVHLDTLTIGKYTFKEIPFVKKNPVMPDADQNTILLGHYFYESEISPKYSIFKSEIEKNNAKYIFLGHDHTPYENVYINNTVLFRPGSTCRNTSNNYNLRIPNYVQLSFDNAGELSYNILPMSVAKPPSEIFNEQIKLNINKKKVLDTENLNISFSKVEVKKLIPTLLDLNTPVKCVDYIEKLHINIGANV